MNFISKLLTCGLVGIVFFVLFILVIGPFLAHKFNWKGNDPTALFGPEWIWNYGFIIFLATFVLSVGYFSLVEKSQKKQPNISYKEPLHYYLSSASGTVESTHAWGRTEVVPVTGVEITYYFSSDCWVIAADVVQPKGRKGYFAPVLRSENLGHIDTQYDAAQFIEYSNCSNEEEGVEINWTEYRCANIVFKNNEPISIHFTHINFKDNKWIPVANYEAFR